MVEWARHVIIQNGNEVVGVLIANSNLGAYGYIRVAGGLDQAESSRTSCKNGKGCHLRQSRGFSWQEEPVCKEVVLGPRS